MELNVCLQDIDPGSALAQSLQLIATGQGTNIIEGPALAEAVKH